MVANSDGGMMVANRFPQTDRKPGMAREHVYTVTLRWTGNQGSGTPVDGGYRRDHTIEALDKHPIDMPKRRPS
jgi:hypothetical protein